jgi:hypothetical protein
VDIDDPWQSRCLTDDPQGWNTFEVAAIMGDRGNSMPHGTGGDP